MTIAIEKDDLVFHSVHGLCRVSTATRSAGEKEPSYTLLPVTHNRGKVRFVIPKSALENSGFSKLISTTDGHAILEYFKTGKNRKPAVTQPWRLATLIWSEAFSKEVAKDARGRQKVKAEISRAVNGLVSELAFVLKMNFKEISDIIQKNLGRKTSINPLVLEALDMISEQSEEMSGSSLSH